MSFKSREKKRQARVGAKIAMTYGKNIQRENYKDRHYLTIVSRPACCNDCGRSLRPAAECVYRFEPREILCKECADERTIPYRPSRRWEKANRKRRNGKLVPAARKPA
jgi:RNase P subunit RPR2